MVLRRERRGGGRVFAGGRRAMFVAFGEGSSRLMADFVDSSTAVDGFASLTRACSSSFLGLAS